MKSANKAIKAFRGKYAFLSNFHPSPVDLGGKTFPTVEHAFQAAKTGIAEQREQIRQAATPARAKQLGRKVDCRPDWHRVKVGIMRELLSQKFTNNPALRGALLETGNAELVESNNWNDTFWGVCRGKGKNMLGKLLMEVREELAQSDSPAVESKDCPGTKPTPKRASIKYPDPSPRCPECGSKRFTYKEEGEYTGGGFASEYTAFTCSKCGHEWESDLRTARV